MHKKIHFIGLNEAIMADLAMILHRQGASITTSSLAPLQEDFIAQHQLAPAILPKYPTALQQLIDNTLDALVVGGEVREDHVELKAAQALGLPIYDYPTYIYQHWLTNKQRMVVIGDPLVTELIFSMAMHVMRVCQRSLDYVATLSGVDVAVSLSTAPLVLIKTDTLPTATFKNDIACLAYHPHIALMNDIEQTSGVADLCAKEYTSLLHRVADALPKAGSLVYNAEINAIKQVGEREREDVKGLPYRTHESKQQGEINYLITPQGKVAVPYVLTEITLQAISAAHTLLKEVAVTSEKFYQAMTSWRPVTVVK